MTAVLQTPLSTGGLSAILACLRRDAPFHAFVAAYLGVGYLVAETAGLGKRFVPVTYLYYTLPTLGFIVVFGGGIWALCSRRPLASLRRAAGVLCRPEGVAAALLYVSLSLHMGIFTSIKTILPVIQPFYADPMLADLDVLLHGSAPWVFVTGLIPVEVAGILCIIYFGLWGILLPICLILCVFSPRLHSVRSIYLWTHLIAWPLLGNVLAWGFMSAGPVYYALVSGDTQRFAGLLEYLSGYSSLSVGPSHLWNLYITGQHSPGGGISAFPSMHLAVATMFVLLASRVNRGLMYAATGFCLLILFCSVLLGWHYAIDGYFSIAATLLIWHIVGVVLRSRRK